MDLEQAFGLLSQVCQEFRGTLADHQNIQTALEIVRQEAFPKLEVVDEDDDDEKPKPEAKT